MPPNYRALVKAYVNSDKYEPKDDEERDWARSCASKVWFRTGPMAARAAARNGLKVYRCRFCPHWHLARRV